MSCQGHRCSTRVPELCLSRVLPICSDTVHIVSLFSAYFPPTAHAFSSLYAMASHRTPQSSKWKPFTSFLPFLLTSVSHQVWWILPSLHLFLSVLFLPYLCLLWTRHFSAHGTSVHTTLPQNNPTSDCSGFSSLSGVSCPKIPLPDP